MISLNRKNEKGITLVTLAVAIIIMLIITSSLIYSITTGSKVRALNNMYQDITKLKDKVDLYYANYHTIPIINVKYKNTSNIASINPNDSSTYYVIDLEALGNINLTYGKDYKTYQENPEESLTDLYVINERSHSIYYVRGVTVDEDIYYTIPEEYTKVEVNDILNLEEIGRNGNVVNIKMYAVDKTNGIKKLTLIINNEPYKIYEYNSDYREIKTEIETINLSKTSICYLQIEDENGNPKQSNSITLNEVNDGSWNGTVNTPKIEGTGLIPVYWNDSSKTWVELTEDSSAEEWNKWYNYESKNWANAKSKDGSMWVWIPRYEYKIDTTNKTISVNFVPIGANTTQDYILHPAFSTDIENGGWSSELPGFWIAKYAAGYQNATVGEATKTVSYSNLKYTTVGDSSNFLTATLTTNTNSSYPVFKANTYAYNIISVADAFLLSQEIDTAEMYGLSNVDSHLVKNSEWGAVAYLTHSQYGVNGNASNMNEVTQNTKNLNNTIYVNNAASGTLANVYAVTSYGDSDTANDVNASSTKNMTGVFDLNGCVWERTAGFKQGGAASTLNWHNAMASSATTNSTRYLTLYTTNNKKGDATNETAGWNGDYSSFVSAGGPVFERGGYYNYGDYAGVFAFGDGGGGPHYNYGFRACLAF